MDNSELDGLGLTNCDGNYFCFVSAVYHTAIGKVLNQDLRYIFYYDKDSKSLKYLGFINNGFIEYVYIKNH